jgi:hypothetical protein
VSALGGRSRLAALFLKYKQPQPTEGQLIQWAHRWQIPAQWLAAIVIIYEAEKRKPLILRNFVRIGNPPYPRSRANNTSPYPTLQDTLKKIGKKRVVLAERDAREEQDAKRLDRYLGPVDPFAEPVPKPVLPGLPQPVPPAPTPVPEQAQPPQVNVLEQAKALKIKPDPPAPPPRRRVIDF